LDLTRNSSIVRDFETKFRHKNGSVIHVLMNTDLTNFKEYKNVLLTSVRSITNLKLIEEELTKERDFISAVLNTAASLVMVLDRDGNIARFNRACEVILLIRLKMLRQTSGSFIRKPNLTKEESTGFFKAVPYSHTKQSGFQKRQRRIFLVNHNTNNRAKLNIRRYRH
jgi:transcriptional regulator with PAS, ATPase and Fis domain